MRAEQKVEPEDFQRLVEAEQRLAAFRVQLREIAKRSGVGYRTIAYRMNTSPSAVERIVGGKNVTLDTLMRFAWACGCRLDLGMRPNK